MKSLIVILNQLARIMFLHGRAFLFTVLITKPNTTVRRGVAVCYDADHRGRLSGRRR